MNKLRVGVILPDHMVPAWVRHMLVGIKNSPHAEVTALAFAGHPNREDRSMDKLHDLHFRLDQWIHHPGPNPWEVSDIREVLHNTQILGESLHERVSRLKAMRLDILLNLSLYELPKSLLDVARFGIWSLRCNNARVTSGAKIGWLEVLEAKPVMRCDIEIHRAESVQLVAGSVIATHPASFTLNQKSFFWRASAVVTRTLRQLHTRGEQAFFSKVETAGDTHKASRPTRRQSISMGWVQIKKIFENKIWRRWFPHRWSLMAGKSIDGETIDWGRLKLMVPPRGAFWADPFLLKKQGQSHLFFEEYSYKTKLGHISYAVLKHDGGMGEPQIALERPYHLSYPFIFEHRGEFYMIPETAQHRAIEVYRCIRFPMRWEFHKTLMPDVQAVDTTLIEYAMRWWMFVNIAGWGGSTWDELHLFFSDDPLSTNWTPHPMNPIVSDVRTARPAGRIFRRDGGLVRPSQDCSLRYGYAVNLNRITKLTIHEYEEELIGRIEPPNDKSLAVHTYNRSDDLVVLDMLLMR